METTSLNIGILNMMHDKVDTKKRFDYVLSQNNFSIKATYFYPKMHYKNRRVPEEVQEIAQPLELTEIEKMDGFIITGAPLEKLEFLDITYWEELQELFDFLKKLKIPQLYVCWGAMAAANYYYGIEKQMLTDKLFGIFEQEVCEKSTLLKGLPVNFKAPHARYAELNHEQISKNVNLEIKAVTKSGHLFLVESKVAPQSFLFAHLEYGKDALTKEYQRELAAYPEKKDLLAKPKNYYGDYLNMENPIFSWEMTQNLFFKNWIGQIKDNIDIG